MPDLQHDQTEVRGEPEVQDDEPEWVLRMRAAGYKIRRGTGTGRLSEIPDAFFYPPPSAPRRFAQRVTNAFRKVLRANPSTHAGNAHLP
jgi:hypothetical protein